MDLLRLIKDAGVIGAGGAGFPTHAKLAQDAEYILLNGAECEPLIRVDQQLMALFPDEIIKGFEAAGRLVHAKKALIGIKEKHIEVISILRQKIQVMGLSDFVEVKGLPDMYPAGDEQVLVYEMTGRIVPEASLPIHVGCVVINSETALNIEKAMKGSPVTEKYITVAGDVPNPVTVKVPVGMPVMDVIKLSGVSSLENYGVVDGGPMMGSVLSDLKGYVTKKTKGFIVLKKDHSLIRKKSVRTEQARRINRSACEQCRMCTDMCPRYLLGHNLQPHKIMRAFNYPFGDLEGQQMALLCSQCGLCELFACPAGLYPKAANTHFRSLLAQQQIRYQSKQDHFEARPPREYRLLPSKRLIARLGLRAFDLPAPIVGSEIMPQNVCILTRQHVGAPAIPVVNVNDMVYSGQLIGQVDEKSLSSPVHASISGIVTQVCDDFISIRRGEDGGINRNA